MQIIIGQPYLNVLHGNRIIALSLMIEHDELIKLVLTIDYRQLYI